MYNLRLQYDKGTPMNLIAKLLMNSLYGKFAMKLERKEKKLWSSIPQLLSIEEAVRPKDLGG